MAETGDTATHRLSSGDGAPKRRSNAAGKKPSGETSRNQAFYFVDENSSSTGKRSHVMKHHIREKKTQQSRSPAGETGSQPLRATRLAPWTKKAAEKILEIDAIQEETGSLNSDCDDESSLRTKPSSAFKHVKPLLEQRTIAASRTDPFETLPVNITDETQELMDLWTTRLAYWSGQNSYMKLAVFKEAILHPMTFHVTILSYSARYRSYIARLKETNSSVAYASTAERRLAEYIQEAADPKDKNTLMGFTALALQEERYGNKEKATQYMDCAMERARDRIGQSPLQETFMHYVRYTMSPRGPLADPIEALQLLSFLRSAESLASSAPSTRQLPMWTDAFQFGTPLHFMLSSGPHPSSVPNDDRMWVIADNYMHDTCRTASLVYVTVSLLDYSVHSGKCARFLEEMLNKIQERGLDRSGSAESLLWLLLEEPYAEELRNPGRAWAVGDWMMMANKLPSQLRFQFGELLLRPLMLRGPDLEISLGKFEGELWKHVHESGRRDVMTIR